MTDSKLNLEDKINAIRQIVDDKDFKKDWNKGERRQLFDELLTLQIDYKKQNGDYYKPKHLNS